MNVLKSHTGLKRKPEFRLPSAAGCDREWDNNPIFKKQKQGPFDLIRTYGRKAEAGKELEMAGLQYDPRICEACETVDCLVRCQYMDFDLAEARKEKTHILEEAESRVLTECATCYACEEYCPNGNHPFYQIVELQEKKGILPTPAPITKQQIIMMQPNGKTKPAKVGTPLINMCAFPMLEGCIRGRLFEGASTISGNDIFCNIMWLHFAKNSVIRERVPQAMERIRSYFLEQSGIEEVICFHDECYGTYTQLAPAFGMTVPFRPVHLFEYLNRRLDELKDEIQPINAKVAYQRPCSNRLVPQTDRLLDEIFQKIGVERVEREYDRENTLCCGGVLRGHQKDDMADDLQRRNIEDMLAAGAAFTIFNCPFCMFTMGEAVAEKGLFPLLVSDLCQMALERK